MKILNIGILAHVDAGKTTLTERVLFESGAIRDLGSVDIGTAHTDNLSIERSRGISVKTACATVKYKNTILNIIDTPGHADFAAEVERSLLALDAAILVVSAVEGVQAQTELIWNALQKMKTKVLIFINKIDRTGSDIGAVLDDCKEKLSNNILFMNEVENEGSRECRVKNADFKSAEFQESIAEKDEECLVEYLEKGFIDENNIKKYIKNAIKESEIIPVFAGAAVLGKGVTDILDFLDEFVSREQSDDNSDALNAVVFRVTHDKKMGRIAHIRLFSGRVENRDGILLPDAEFPEKVSQIRKYQGTKLYDTGEVSKGEIAAICGLSNVRAGDIIGELHDKIGISFSRPLLNVKAECGKEKQQELLHALTELEAEDPLLKISYNQEEQEILISVTGAIQIEVLGVLLSERYNLNVTFSEPSIIYRETPASSGIGYDAYTMPKPCWAVVKLLIEPLKRGEGYKYSADVPHNQMNYCYQEHIKKALPKAMEQGLYNWQVDDISIKLIGGEHHNIHTHPLDFFLCTPIAFMKGMRECGSILLEPLQSVRFIIPEECSGKLMGDIISMRGEFDSPVIKNGSYHTQAVLPLKTSLDYSVRLSSITSGRGMMSVKFHGYRECPPELGAVAKRRGINPLDREKWILSWRQAL